MILNWKKYFPTDYQAMQSVVMMSALVLLTSSIRAISQYTSIPEEVKLLQRQEEVSAREVLGRDQKGSGSCPC